MGRCTRFELVASAALLTAATTLAAQERAAPEGQWPQFLGPGGTGVAEGEASPPTEFGPEKALLWKTDIPNGAGSPCVWGDRVFVTAFDETAQTLEVIAVDRRDGTIAWRRPVATEGLEKVHAVSSPATSTPATDGERVYVYFGSFGLLAYEWDGTPAWEYPMGVSESPFGSGTSPVLVGDVVLMTRDFPPGPFMIAVERSDGRLAWKVDLVEKPGHGPRTGHSTPAIWRNQIVLHRPGEVAAYSPENGRRLWWVDTASPGTSTPSPGGEALFVTAFPMLADPANTVEVPPFSAIVAKYDASGDGKLSPEELPENDLYLARRAGVPDDVPGAHFPMKRIFWMVDADKDGLIGEADFDQTMATLKEMSSPTAATGLVAIQPGADPATTMPAVKWTYERNVPEVPSPMSYRGHVYMIKAGGIVSCVEQGSGDIVYRGRVGARGTYYASPVAAGGKIFVASAEGVVTVLGSSDTLEVLANNDLGDPIYGTPAPVGRALYVRSANHLWAFGEPSSGTRVD